MTDEQKAKEYADYFWGAELRAIKQAYLDGLKEGKPKWHDLRKDPNDLPKHSGEYWCRWGDGTYSSGYYFDHNGFGSYVLAWCEFPKFEE